MAGVRLRTRRRQFGWIRVVAVAAVALLGGAALWSGLSTSEAHAARQKLRSGAAQEPQPGSQDAADEGGGGKDDTHANLDAWTQLTTVGGGSSGSGSASRGGSGSEGGAGGGAAQQQGGRQDEQAAAQQGQQTGGSAAGSGSQQGGPGLGAASGYVTIELKVPKAPPSFNSWVQSEDMLLWHLRALQQQLEQVYVGMALAAATGRAFILPQLQCFCQNAAQALSRCRRPDSGDLQFPVACPEGDVLMPLPDLAAGGEAQGMPLHVEPLSAAQGIANGQTLVLRPSATILWPKCASTPPDPSTPDNSKACTKESTESGTAVLSLPPSLNDTHLLPFLEPHQKYKLWRLDFSDVGSHWHAFAGWECAEPAKKFDQRLSRAVKPWPAPSGSSMQQLGMTAGRTYSTIPRLKDCPPGTNAAGGSGAAAGGRRLQRQQGKRRRPEDIEL